MKRLTCRNCDAPLPENSDPRRKYCAGTRCRQQFNERRKAETKSRTMRARNFHGTADPEVREMVSRATDVLEDEIRDTMREVIKEEITPMIREKAQGAVVVMLDLLPKALARLAEDLESKDAVARRTAMAIAFKYTMPTVQENTKVQTDRSHTVYTYMQVDDTTVGKKVQEELAYNARENYEDFEADYPVCQRCDQRTHPDNMTGDSNGLSVCNSCNIRLRIEGGNRSMLGFLEDPLLN